MPSTTPPGPSSNNTLPATGSDPVDAAIWATVFLAGGLVIIRLCAGPPQPATMNEPTLELFEPAAWTRDAACRNMNPDLWFHTADTSIKQAVKVCNTCPVKTECLEHALTRPERFGVWGGLNPNQRRQIRIRRGHTTNPEAVCGTNSGYQKHLRLNQPTCDTCKQAHNIAIRNFRIIE